MGKLDNIHEEIDCGGNAEMISINEINKVSTSIYFVSKVKSLKRVY
jgi:hypothetical protein